MRPKVVVAHPSTELYGSDRLLLASVSALRDAGWYVLAAVPQDGALVPQLRDRADEVRLLDFPVLRKSLLRPSAAAGLLLHTVRSVLLLWRFLRAERPDVVYVNTVTIPVWLFAARLAGVPAVCHVREAEEGVRRPLRVALTAPLLLARAIVVNSAATGRLVELAFPRLRARTELIYNGIRPPAAELPPPRTTLTDPVRLVLVGRLAPRKGIDLAISAVRRLRGNGTNVELSLAGDVFRGYEWFEQRMRAEAAPLGDAVRFLGFCPDVWPVFATADIVLVPSRVEPFGNVAVEAMLACRPVVVANVQGLAEIVFDDTIGSLVEPDDAGALAAAVQALIDNWAQARERAFRARDDAQRRFGADRYRSELAAALLRASGLPAGNLSPSTVFAASASGTGSGRRPVQDGQVQ